VSINPQDEGEIAVNGVLTMTFDEAPEFVKVNGQPAIIDGLRASWRVSGLTPGQTTELTITWNGGTKIITLKVLPNPSVCVDFEPPLNLGTQYGQPAGHNPGDVVFTTNNIPVTVENFDNTATNSVFNVAFIDSPPHTFGKGQTIRLNNISLMSDFSGLGFDPSKLTFDFLDAGGTESLSDENGVLSFVGDFSSVPASIGGMSITVSATPIYNSQNVIIAQKGTVTLTGNVKKLLIGGQELWIDHVCAQK